MNRNIYYQYLCLMLLAIFCLTACINDDSEYGSENNIPTLKVSGEDAESMPVYNFNLGETVQITPEVSYTGDPTQLTYNWKVGTYTNGVKGVLKDVGDTPQFTYTFERGGTYYAHLTVTDGQVGRAVDYQINSQGRIETWRKTIPSYVMLHLQWRWNHLPKKDKPILLNVIEM